MNYACFDSTNSNVYGDPMSGIKVWIDQDLGTGDGICEEIAPAIFFGAEDGLYYVREAGTEAPTEPTHSFHEPVDVPDDLVEATIDAAEECPGECIFLDVE